MNEFDIFALEKNFRARFTYFQERFPEMTVCCERGPLLIDSGMKTDMFNIICASGEEERSSVGNCAQHFRMKELPYCWWVGFEEDPNWLKEELEAIGLKHSEAELVMAARKGDVLWSEKNSDLELKQVSDSRVLGEFLSVFAEIIPAAEMHAITQFYHRAADVIFYDDSAIQFFVGYIDGEPVATSSVFYAEELASIFDVIVSPKMRGRGLGKSVTLAAMEKAAERAYDVYALTATNDAKYLYEKLGFKSLKLMSVYAP